MLLLLTLYLHLPRSVSDWAINSTNNSYSRDWGLGNFIEDKQSNERTYSWYLGQLNTGFDSIDNCGPTTVTMVCKWADSTFTKTPQDARMSYESAGGWWFTPDIDNYLTDNNITHGIMPLSQTAEGTRDFLKKQIDLKQVVILCIDMNFIRLSNNENYRSDKFYPTTPGFGHSLSLRVILKLIMKFISRYMIQTAGDKKIRMALIRIKIDFIVMKMCLPPVIHGGPMHLQ
ncbi:MAG: hypothetical protein ABI863_01915 [Ginsengibacter sp.]